HVVPGIRGEPLNRVPGRWHPSERLRPASVRLPPTRLQTRIHFSPFSGGVGAGSVTATGSEAGNVSCNPSSSAASKRRFSFLSTPSFGRLALAFRVPVMIHPSALRRVLTRQSRRKRSVPALSISAHLIRYLGGNGCTSVDPISSAHGLGPAARRSFARMATAEAHEPARPCLRGRDLDQALELPRDRPRAAFPRHDPASCRPAGGPVAGAQRAADQIGRAS